MFSIEKIVNDCEIKKIRFIVCIVAYMAIPVVQKWIIYQQKRISSYQTLIKMLGQRIRSKKKSMLDNRCTTLSVTNLAMAIPASLGYV